MHNHNSTACIHKIAIHSAYIPVLHGAQSSNSSTLDLSTKIQAHLSLYSNSYAYSSVQNGNYPCDITHNKFIYKGVERAFQPNIAYPSSLTNITLRHFVIKTIVYVNII